MGRLMGVEVPAGYEWLIDRRLVGFEPFTQLRPWFYVEPDKCFWATERWPGVTDKQLLVFARRQDCDDLACFVVENNQARGVALIQGWSGAGFVLVEEYPDFWAWLKTVVEDIGELVDLRGESADARETAKGKT